MGICLAVEIVLGICLGCGDRAVFAVYVFKTELRFSVADFLRKVCRVYLCASCSHYCVADIGGDKIV